MSQKKLPKKWQGSNKSIRAVQIAFEFNQAITSTIRDEAAKQGLSPSDLIRQVIGLKAKEPQRPRLTVSLSEQDYQQLADKFALANIDKEVIREEIRQQLITYSDQLLASEKKHKE